MSKMLNHILKLYKEAQVAKKADEEEKYEFGHPIYNLLSEAQSAMFPEEFQDFEEYVQNNREKFYNEIKNGKKPSDIWLPFRDKWAKGFKSPFKTEPSGYVGVNLLNAVRKLFRETTDNKEKREKIEKLHNDGVLNDEQYNYIQKYWNVLERYSSKANNLTKKATIMDEILDRKEGVEYDARLFYEYVINSNEPNAERIAKAIADGDEEQVKKELLAYIPLSDHSYDPETEKYIKSVRWIDTKGTSKKAKETATTKKAENEDLIAIGWGLYTYENNIKANAEDDGRTIDRDFWNKINNDIDKVESWFLKEGYKQFFTKVRDEGHGKDSELGGTAFVTEEQLKNFIDRADGMNGAYTLTETSGVLEFPIDYDETIFFELVIFVDEKILDDLNIESKKNIKNKKQSSKTKSMRKRAFTPKEIEFINKEKEKQIECGEFIYKAKNALYGDKVEECKDIVKQMPENCKLNFVISVKREGEDKYYPESINEIFKEIPQNIISEAEEILKENPNTLYVSEWQRKSSKTNKLNKKAEERLYKAMWYDNNGNKKSELHIGKSTDINELKESVRDFLFEKRKNRESNPHNNSFFLRDKIVIEDFNTGKTIETIKVSDLLSTYGKDYWKSFMETKATKKSATIKHENGVYNVYSESGKCLGKGYKTKEEAEKRLKQVEYFKHKNASVLKRAKANLNGIIRVMDKMWHGTDDKNYITIGKWGIGIGGYDTGYVISYDGNELFAITPDNVYDAWQDDDFVKELTGYTQKEIFQFIKDNYKHADLPNLEFNGSKIDIETNKKSLKSIVISKMAKSLKDIPDSVKKNILSDLVYVILTGKGSFAYKTVAKKLEAIIKELGYGDKLKANEDGSLPTMEIVELISKEPKVMDFVGKFANITRAF